MKKLGILLLSVVAIILLISCGAKKSDSESSLVSESVSNVNYGSGKEISFTFEANSTTGFDWQYEFKDGDAELVFEREDIKPNENGDIVGGNMQRTYFFRANKSGKTKLVFTYKRPWEGGEVEYDVVYDLSVDDNLIISCYDKKKGVVETDKELDFFPNPVFIN